jgi:dienelactone hydrolase
MRRPSLAALVSFSLALGQACAVEISIPATAPDGSVQAIPATLLRPEGRGPFAGIVMLHDCSGVGPRSSGAPARWARELSARGYVIIIPDSFSTRGFPAGICTDPSPGRGDVSMFRRPLDAYAALDYLRTLDYVDGMRIGVMGNSHGGASTLTTLMAPEAVRDPRAGKPGFAAGVALYPDCTLRRPGRLGNTTPAYRALAPVYILIGELDDWTPAEPCRRLASGALGEHKVALKVYPGVHHSFDNDRPVNYVATRINPRVAGGRGATTGGDPAAWADSINEVVAFFAKHLGAAR